MIYSSGNPEPLALMGARISPLLSAVRRQPDQACFFEIYREEEVSVTSTLFAGGDWHWRLVDADDRTLVEAGGYATEENCREAVSVLQRQACLAKLHPQSTPSDH